MSDNHDMCRGALKMARYAAQEVGVKLPSIKTSKLSLDEYAVFVGDAYVEYGACCAFEARGMAIYDIIDVRTCREATSESKWCMTDEAALKHVEDIRSRIINGHVIVLGDGLLE